MLYHPVTPQASLPTTPKAHFPDKQLPHLHVDPTMNTKALFPSFHCSFSWGTVPYGQAVTYEIPRIVIKRMAQDYRCVFILIDLDGIG